MYLDKDGKFCYVLSAGGEVNSASVSGNSVLCTGKVKGAVRNLDKERCVIEVKRL